MCWNGLHALESALLVTCSVGNAAATRMHDWKMCVARSIFVDEIVWPVAV